MYNYHSISAQSFLNYVLLCLIYTTLLACRQQGEQNILTVFKSRGWKYFILALIDVEANYLMVKAYHYTTVTSVQVGPHANAQSVIIVPNCKVEAMHTHNVLYHGSILQRPPLTVLRKVLSIKKRQRITPGNI